MTGQYLVYFVVGLSLVYEAYLTLKLNRDLPVNRRESISKWVIIGCSFSGVFGGFCISSEAREVWFSSFNTLRFMSVPIVLISVGLRFLAVKQLGSAFCIDSAVRPDQPLQTKGMYRFIRHPSYTSGWLAYLGLAFAFYHPLTSTMVALLPIVGLLYRIHIEEKMLVEAFGDRYREYQKRTKRLIPFIL